jgi:CRISPR-associated protein Csm5
MKVYLLRVSTLVAKGGGRFELGWKSPRGSSEAKRIDESTPIFAEMAVPGTTFEGQWDEKSAPDRQRLFQASNKYAAAQLAQNKQYAALLGLLRLGSSMQELEKKLESIGSRQDACLLAIGWGGGLLSKVAVGDTADADYRSILKHIALFQRAIETGLPFPKTRKIVFEGGQPSCLPGWAVLEVM